MEWVELSQVLESRLPTFSKKLLTKYLLIGLRVVYFVYLLIIDSSSIHRESHLTAMRMLVTGCWMN